jgi:Na+/H+ antiporter NhaC
MLGYNHNQGLRIKKSLGFLCSLLYAVNYITSAGYRAMKIMRALLPLTVFLLLFLGSGIYFYTNDVEFAFYQVSPVAAVLPAIIIAMLTDKSGVNKKIDAFIEGMRNKDIITMCVIFLLAGAFGTVTASIGAVQATVDFMLALVPPTFLVPGLFLISAFVSTAMGTSMGVIATIMPIAVGLASSSDINLALTAGSVIGGAMFGDNLSMISDTTIAAVQTTGADLRKKFVLNAKLALVAASITVVLLAVFGEVGNNNYREAIIEDFVKILPYILIVVLAFCKIHVFAVLTYGIVFTFLVGMYSNGYEIIQLGKDIFEGFTSMNEIMLLTLMIAGLVGVMKHQGSLALLIDKLEQHLQARQGKASKRYAEFMLLILAGINDILIANNTIAILLGGVVAKNIAEKHNIAPERAACWLDISSCVFQGIMPYTAQVLLASSIAGLSPIEVVPYVIYCYILAGVTLTYIIVGRSR